MLKRIRGVIVMLGECVRMSLQNIFSNRARSFLTLLGILIGVSAVIALITTVNGFSSSLTSSFSAMGAGSLTVQVTGSDLKSGLSQEDLSALTDMEIIAGVTPNVTLNSRVSRGGSYESGVTVSGVNSYYFRSHEDAIARGRELNALDEDYRTFVCLVNSDMVETFFYGVDPIDREIYIAGLPFTVVGVLSDDSKQSVSTMMSGSPDILIPYTTALKMSNANVVTSLTVYLADGVNSDAASEEIEAEMDAMFSYEEDCFSIVSMSGIEETMESMLSMVSTLLAGIASIALIVGGIGIMNMMLTTVTERTAEIGLKKALGALSWQIQAQFLIESFSLSMMGGALGVLIGLLLSLILSRVMGTSFVISVQAILLGAGFSAAVGIIFGWAPARKASKLNPIDALRSV